MHSLSIQLNAACGVRLAPPGRQPARRARASRSPAVRAQTPASAAPADAARAQRTARAEGDALLAGASAAAAPAKWWEMLAAPNLFTAATAADLRAVLQRANEGGRTRLVAVEFFGEACPGCRALGPKLASIARQEFPSVLFVKVNVNDSEVLAKELGVELLPTFQLYTGTHGLVAQFTATLTQQSLSRLRLMLKVHSTERNSLAYGQRGPASVFHAKGWPVVAAGERASSALEAELDAFDAHGSDDGGVPVHIAFGR